MKTVDSAVGESGWVWGIGVALATAAAAVCVRSSGPRATRVKELRTVGPGVPPPPNKIVVPGIVSLPRARIAQAAKRRAAARKHAPAIRVRLGGKFNYDLALYTRRVRNSFMNS